LYFVSHFEVCIFVLEFCCQFTTNSVIFIYYSLFVYKYNVPYDGVFDKYFPFKKFPVCDCSEVCCLCW